MINDIAFKGKRSVEWSDVEKYLRQYVGDIYRIAETEDIIYIGTDLPDEYSGSNYTKHIKGTIAKAKANAVQAIPEMIEIATSKTFEDNKKNKHSRHAKNGWYRYDTRFAVPVYDENGDVERYNVFSARLLIRHAASGKMYLYDVLEIKKETEKLSISYSLKSKNQAPASFQLALASFKIPAKVFFSSSFSIAI